MVQALLLFTVGLVSLTYILDIVVLEVEEAHSDNAAAEGAGVDILGAGVGQTIHTTAPEQVAVAARTASQV